MKFLTGFSLKNTIVILLAVVMLIAGGLYSASSAQTEAMPNISVPIITVATLYPGASPQDISETVSKPLQKAISGLQGINKVNATSNENISVLVVEFDYAKDLDKAEKEVQDAVSKVALPDQVKEPAIARIGFNSQPVMSYSISGTMNQAALNKYVNDKIKPSLSGINGVSSVTVDGIGDKKIVIKADEKKLQENNMTLQDLQQAISANDISFPAGSVDISGQSLTVKASRKIASLNDIKSIPLIVMPNPTAQMGKGMPKANNTPTAVVRPGDYEIVNQVSIMRSKDLGAILGKNVEWNKDTKQVIIGGKNFTPLKNQDGKTYVGIKEVAEAFGHQVEWDSRKKIISISQKGGSVLSTGGNLIKTVFLSDVAAVSLESPESGSVTRANLKPAVILNIYKNDDANTVNVAANVASKIENLEKSNTGLQIEKLNDTSKMVKDSVNGMAREGLLGAFFAILVIALFLRDVRATVIAVVSIPLSILISLILLPQFDITLNTMSLSGMAVAVGRIVDDSIVVIENIYRRLQARKNKAGGDLIEDAAGEVSSAITSSTLTTVAVFLPLTMISGLIGKIFIPFAITVVICMLASLLVAVTVVPVMSKFMLLKKPAKQNEGAGKIAKSYQKILQFSLSHRALVVVSALIFVAVSLTLVTRVGVQFIPSSTSGVLTAKLDLPQGTALAKTDEEAAKLENYLLTDPGIKSEVDIVTSSIGDTSGNGGFMFQLQGTNQAKITIALKETADKEQALAEIKDKAKSMGEGKWNISSSSANGMSENLEVVVNGDNIKDIKAASDIITKKLNEVDSITNISNNLSATKPEIAIKVNEQKAAEKGLSPIMVAGMVRNAFNYDKVTTVVNQGKSTDVLLGYDNKQTGSLGELENLAIKGLSGTVKLKEIADVKIQDGPASISERDGNRYASITADITAKDTGKVTQDVKDKLSAINSELKPGITYSVGGSMEQISSGFQQMAMAMVIAIFLVFVTMLIALKEVSAALAILFSLPFAAVGALLALVITNHPVSMSGLIGILMLIGIVVTNAIVLIDRVLSNRAKGMDIQDALLEAGAVRLRPIFMTAAATIMALIPLAVGFSEGALISQELGIVVIGGLTLSTVLTLVIVPVAYSLLEDLKRRFTKEEATKQVVIPNQPSIGTTV